jgi:PAS domain S-box-containing protein
MEMWEFGDVEAGDANMQEQPQQQAETPRHASIIAQLRSKLDDLASQPASGVMDAELQHINARLDRLIEAGDGFKPPQSHDIQFRSLIDNLPVGVLVQGPQAEIFLSNQAALDLLGLTLEQLIGVSSFDPLWNVIHEDGTAFPGETHPVPQAIATKQAVSDVVMGVYRPTQNDRVWLLVNAEPELDENGDVVNVVCTFSDITKTRQLEAELRLTNERYLRATEAGKIGVWEWDLVTNQLYLDANFRTLFGYSAEDTLDEVNFWREAIHPDDRQMVDDRVQQYLQGELPTYMIEARIIHKDGELRWMLVRSTVERDDSGQARRLIGSHMDITERKQTELTLRESEGRYRALFQNSERQALERRLLDAVRFAVAHELDLTKVIRTIVETIAETYGYTLVSLYLLQDEVLHLQYQVGYDTVIAEIPIDRGVSGDVVRSGQAILIEDVQQVPNFLGAIQGIVSEITVPLLDGETVVGTINVESVEGTVLTEADLRLVTALSAHINVAIQLARLYTELREKETRARALLNAIPDMMVRMRRDGQFLEMKPATYFRPAFPPEIFVSKTVYDIFSPDIAAIAIQTSLAALETGTMQAFEYELEGKQGIRTFEALIVPYQADEILSIIREITIRKQAIQRELELAVERERVDILTEFIQNASHDFRTPLAVMINNLYLLRHVPDPAQRDHYVGVIERQVTHLSHLLDNMLTITRLDSAIPMETEAVNLNLLLQELVTHFEGLVEKKDIGLRLDLTRHLDMIRVDVQGVNRVLSNLVYNSIRHTPSGGEIRLASRMSDEHVVIEVSDTGSGISAEQLPRIFDRFYRGERHRPSNLETGGAGLGLSIAKKIVEAHGGTIAVESEVGVGTTFRIYMPKL